MSDKQTIVRSRRCGLKDIYLARVTKNTAEVYQAEAPEKFARAVTAKISDKYTSEKIYSDDGTEEVVASYQGTDVELEVNTLAPQDRARLWAHLYEAGFLVETAEDNPPELAMGFRTRQLNGKYEFVWLYCGKFDQGNDEEYETIADKKNHKTATAKASFYERAKADQVKDPNTGEASEKHLYRVRVDESNLAADATEAAKAIKNWFSQVQEYSGVSADGNDSQQADDGETDGNGEG